MTYQVTSSFFCAGVRVRGNIIFDAAPILDYTKGWTVEKLKNYCRVRNWTLQAVDPKTDAPVRPILNEEVRVKRRSNSWRDTS